MAYVKFIVEGNTSYGGYYSVNGGKSQAIKHDMIYEVENGHYHFKISEKSSAVKGASTVGRLANLASSNTSVMYDAYMAHQAGDDWTFSVDLTDDTDALCIYIYSKGQSFYDAPEYKVVELDEEYHQELKAQFEAIRNTPRRNKKQIGWGIGLMAAFGFGTFNMISSGEAEPSGLIFFIGMIGLGALLFLLGMRKIIRK